MHVPPAAVDGHVHVVDPARFPFPDRQGRELGPEELGDAAALDGVLTGHGLERALLVQPSFYGTDNAAMLAALAASGGRHRGIAVVAPEVEEGELDRLAAAGVVGVRFNIARLGPAALTEAGPLLGRLGRRGWLAQLYCPAAELPALASILDGADLRLVIDHLGCPDPTAGPRAPGFQEVLRHGRAGRAVVKLSGAFRHSREPWPHADLDPFVAELLAAFGPERCIWGSDWPFVRHRPRPAYRDTLALIERWLPEPADRHTVLVASPARHFGFAPSPA